MQRPPGTTARPSAYTALLLALAVLASLLLPAGSVWAGGGAPDHGPTSEPTPTREAPQPPSDVDPAVEPGPRTEAKPLAGGGKRAESRPRSAQRDERHDGAAAQPAARPEAGSAGSLARAAAADPPVAADCAVLPLAPFGDPGATVGKSTVPGKGSSCFSFTTVRTGLHWVLVANPDVTGRLQVFDGDTPLDCAAGRCDLTRTGTFTLKVINDRTDPHEFHVSVVPLGAGTPGCLPSMDTPLGAAPIRGSSPSPLTVLCQPFTARPGDRMLTRLHAERYGSEQSWITDESGAMICAPDPDGHQGCVLPGEGPYRLIGRIMTATDGFPAPYSLRIQRLSQPEGCQTVPVNRYGSVPTASTPGVDCKTFTVPATGPYDAYLVRGGTPYRERVYDRAGLTVCEAYEQPCELSAGTTYTLHTDADPLVLSRTSDAGCEALTPGVHRGSLIGGAIHCLTLPYSPGVSVALPQSYATDDVRTASTVLDATGKQLCDWEPLSEGACLLTGPGPFRAHVLADDEERTAGPYALTLIRTDDPGECRTLPAGDFTAQSPSVSLSTGGGAFAECLAVPASDHSPVEALQLGTTAGSSRNADVYVIDSDGERVCSVDGYSGGTWSVCDFRPGAAYTVLFTGVDRPASHTLARRDVTRSAQGCVTTPAVRIGGPSTAGKAPSWGEMTCHRVTTARAADALHLNVRDPEQALFFSVFDADGGWIDCFWARACGAGGSTTYQVVVSPLSGSRPPASYRFDALRIRTGSTPAPECVKAPSISYGHGPISGTLNERATAHCVALPTARRDEFDVSVSDTAGGSGMAVPALYNTDLSNTCSQSRGTTTDYRCFSGYGPDRSPEPTVLVVGLPEDTSSTSYRLRLDCASRWCGKESRDVTGVSPATGAAKSTVTLKVSGSVLHEEDRVRILSGRQQIDSTTVSVTPDRRTLTVRLALTTATTGNWSMSVITRGGWERPLGSFKVTPAALKHTKVPTVSGTARVGAKLTARPGTWTPSGTSFGYQWKADGRAISRATGSTYTVPAALLGKRLSVTVTARRTGHPAGTATSAAVTVAKGSAPKATGSPTISGTVKVGRKLTVKPGTWTPAATSFGHRWYANGQAISGATKSTLTLKSAQRGKKITVRVTAKRTGHVDGAAVTKPTSSVAR
ncbi:cell surface protein [Streptomyces sp. NPDC059578]|uniref:cell surface protein n=1 Tax=Streptomyces sp. NPDC059578 TaxID=3346874 RepID=UPI003690C0A1